MCRFIQSKIGLFSHACVGRSLEMRVALTNSDGQRIRVSTGKHGVGFLPGFFHSSGNLSVGESTRHTSVMATADGTTVNLVVLTEIWNCFRSIPAKPAKNSFVVNGPMSRVREAKVSNETVVTPYLRL
jgi:hypothetical protein